jgi:hypothetical protein
VARCHEQLGKLASAWSEYNELAHNDSNKPRAKEAGKLAKALEPACARPIA